MFLGFMRIYTTHHDFHGQTQLPASVQLSNGRIACLNRLLCGRNHDGIQLQNQAVPHGLAPFIMLRLL